MSLKLKIKIKAQDKDAQKLLQKLGKPKKGYGKGPVSEET